MHLPHNGTVFASAPSFSRTALLHRSRCLERRGLGALADTLQPRADCIRAFYLATAPDLFGPICDRIGAYRLITDRSRLVVEKPFGKDLASARVLNDAIGRISPK